MNPPPKRGAKPKDKGFEIHGKVAGRDGIPLEGARVVVWWQHIRERTELAAGETSEDGTFHLNYEVPEDAPKPILLVVEALSEHLEAPLLSPQTQAQPNLEVDLNFESPDQSEWATLVRLIEPLIGDLELDELVQNSTHQDISFLAAETGQNTDAIMRVAVSARLEAAFKVPAPAFYAFLRQRVPTSLPSPLLDASQNFTLIDALVHQIGSLIFNLPSQIQLQTLTAAVALDIIPSRLTAHLKQIVSELQALRTTDLLNQPFLIGNSTLGQLLSVTELNDAKQQAFAQALATNTQSMRSFWRTLGDGQHGFTAADASAIERTLSIGSFVKNFVPLVKTLFQGFTAGTYTTTADLARLSVTDWVKMVNQTGAPPGIDAAGAATPAEVFAKVVYARVTRTYPTIALASRITGGKFVQPAQQGPLIQFFKNNSTLELIKDNFPAYLAGQGAKALAGIGKGDQEAVKANARRFQRVLRVTQDPDVAETLLTLNINSATQIAAMGQQQFFVKATTAGLTKPEANQVFEIASQRYASVVSLYMQLNHDALGVWPQGMGQVSTLDPTVQQAVQQDPTLEVLFGSQDYCVTDDCTSVLSPAAYLCDLLLWLRNHQQGAKNALDVLNARRPDIANLLLNCPNTDTELPYIDLVNELLADKISPVQNPAPSINPMWKQTSEGVTSEQLSAAPQYFNQGAYHALFGANYPWTLPYSTGLDELRTYLQQWNLPLWQLRQALMPVGGGSVAQQAAVAAERLGMNIQAENLVTQPNYVAAQFAWNTNDFTTTSGTGLGTVSVFLQASSLTYESLLELLEVEWVQGGVNIALVQVDDTCDTTTQTLSPAPPAQASPLDPGFLDRENRFLRLWAATGYKMWELDLLLGAPSVGNGILNQQTLVALQAFWQLQNASNLAVDQLLAFYQDMDTDAHRNPDGSTTTSLYAQVFLNPTVTWVAPDPDMANLPGAVTSPYIQTGLTNGTAYSYIVTAVNSVGESAASGPAPAAATTPAEPAAAPPQPAGVGAIQGDTQSIIISWNTVAEASGYNIYWSPVSPATAASARIAVVASPYIHTGLTNGNAYYYAVTAVNSVGESVLSPARPVTPAAPAAALPPPATVAATLGNAQMTIKWDTVVGASSHNIYWLAGPGVTKITGTKITGVVSPYVQTGLANGTAYSYIVTAVNSVGEGVASNPTPPATPIVPVVVPQPPGGVSAVPGNAQMTINWDPVPGASSYNIYWLAGPGVTKITGKPIPGKAIGDPVMSDHMKAIQPALGVSAADAATLFALTDNQLTLDNLSLIYRVNTLAIASNLSVSALLTAASLLNPAAATPAAAVAPLVTSPAATLAFLTQVTNIQQSGLSLDALTYLLTPPSAPSAEASGGWATTTQMTPADISAALGAVQQAVLNLQSAKTTLASPITNAQTSIVVTSDAGFPSPNFYVYVGSEIMEVTAVGGTGNTTWTVLRGQQGTAAESALSGTGVTPTVGDLEGAVVAAVAANAQSSTNSPLTPSTAAPILQNLNVPGVGQPLLNVLMDPSLIAATGAITIGGSPVAGVAATQGDTQTVIVSWDPVPGASSYNIYWSPVSPVTTANAKIPGVKSPYAQTGLTNGTTYYYVVAAVNSVGEGAASSQASATPAAPAAAPPAPTGVAATQGDTQTVIVSWDSVPEVSSYNIYWLAGPGVTKASGTPVLGVSSPYAHAGLANGTAYSYIVAAKNFVGEGAASTPVATATPAAPAAPPPSPSDTLQAVLTNYIPGVTVTVSYALTPADDGGVNQTAADFAQAINNSQAVASSPTGVAATQGDTKTIVVSWNPVPEVSRYNIYWSPVSPVTKGVGTKIPGVKSPYAHIGLTNGTTYYYIVVAENSVGEGAASSQASATPAAPAAAPPAPTGVAATQGDTKTIVVSWNPVPEVSRYNIYWLAGPVVTKATGATIGGVSSPYAHAGLANGTVYSYIVVAVNSVGEGAASSQASATPAAPAAAPPAPTGVAATQGDTQTVIVSWDSVPEVSSYNIYWLAGPTVNKLTGAKKVGVKSPYVQNGLTNRTAYSYIVAAVNSVSEGAASTPVATATPAAPTTVPGGRAFLAQCAVSGAVITLVPLAPGAAGSSVVSVNTATPGGAGHVSVSPGTTETIGLPAFPPQFLAVQLYDKVGILVRGLSLVAADLTWLLDEVNAAVYGGLDLTQLPVATDQLPLGLSPLLTTLLVIKLARRFTDALPSSSVQTLYDVIEGVNDGSLASKAQVQSAIANITGWPLTDIEAFSFALGLVYPASYTQPATYDSLRTLEAMSSAVGVAAAPSATLVSGITAVQTSITVSTDIGFPSPNFYVNIGSEILLVTAVGGADNTKWTVQRGQQGTTPATAPMGAAVGISSYGAQIVTWGTVPADELSAETLAASALGTLKAQQPSDAAWLALAPTLMNPIRENRSAALQAYLIAERDGLGNLIYGDSNGLFDYFLIDTKMSSCEPTSRIVQAYIAVQIFVQRCLMNMEPFVAVDLTQDGTWTQWEWMSRYRIWEANREVFLWPENWLIESERPNRTEIFKTFEQEVHQGQTTADNLETIVLNYIDRLDGIAHLRVTGTCEDPATGTIYVVARTPADPPTFYLRSYATSATGSNLPMSWSGWTKIPLDIKAHQVIPAMYRGRVCLFWPEVKVSNEPAQTITAPQPSSTPPSQSPDQYVTLGLYFSIFRNGSWAPAQTSKDKFFDKPLQLTNTGPNTTGSGSPAINIKTIEALYTLKIGTPLQSIPGYSADIWVDLYRQGAYDAIEIGYLEWKNGNNAAANLVAAAANAQAATLAMGGPYPVLPMAPITPLPGPDQTSAVHIGRAFFDGRFSDLELNNGLFILVDGDTGDTAFLYKWAQSYYGPEAQALLPLDPADPSLTGEPNLLPQEGALVTQPVSQANLEILPGAANPSVPLTFTSLPALYQSSGTLLGTAQLPFRLVGPDTDIGPGFDPTGYFFFQDNRRCYYVESQKFYQTGSTFSPVTPSNPGSVPYQERYYFHVFYHPFARLFWNQLARGGFDFLYDSNLQQNPDQIDQSQADVFSFQTNYNPNTPPVWWDHDDVIGNIPQGDRQFLDFRPCGAYAVYNWELFYHIPLYIAQLLSQNMQFDDATTWFRYIFNPTSTTNDPVPQRFWIPKPLHDLPTTTMHKKINSLLLLVNEGDPNSVAEVKAWRSDPFNPFVLADMRNGVPYMKSAVMSYLDNLIAEGDNLFATQSREALSEATLLYVTASQILGPTPSAVPPPQAVEASFNDLAPTLDTFADSVAEIENVVGVTGATEGSSGGATSGAIPSAQTLYFKIPPNETLLGYWSTVANRLFKLRHCQTLGGAPLQLALFDAPIDPGLLIQAQLAGVDLTSVLSDISVQLPSYRFSALYSQASDFVNAVRSYGASLLSALEKGDAAALSLLVQTQQQQLLEDGDQILDYQVQQANSNISALNEALALAQARQTFYQSQVFANPAELVGLATKTAAGLSRTAAGVLAAAAAGARLTPDFHAGGTGAFGSPTAVAAFGGSNLGASMDAGAKAINALADFADTAAAVSSTVGGWQRRMDNWVEGASEATIQIAQTQAQLEAASFALQIAQNNQTLHQEQIDNMQKSIDFLNTKFAAESLYDWMAGELSTIYFQSYQLAYRVCKQVEQCYQFELGVFDTPFIQFGYWDSLYKGLSAGESLNQDLRRMQASYTVQNARRYEISRFIPLTELNPAAFADLLDPSIGACDFAISESFFDHDYPGHFNRRILRGSLSVVYPNPRKFHNIKATLAMTANKVRVSSLVGASYAENPVNSDPRFVYNYSPVTQTIVTGNAQDDPGLFATHIAHNLSDPRYLPFEGGGAISKWHIEMPQKSNQIDLTKVTDVVIHLYYTALDGGVALKQAASPA